MGAVAMVLKASSKFKVCLMKLDTRTKKGVLGAILSCSNEPRAVSCAATCKEPQIYSQRRKGGATQSRGVQHAKSSGF